MPKARPLRVAMERLTAPELIYVMGSQEIRPVKIGRSIDPDGRAVELQSGHLYLLGVLWRHAGDALLEMALHREFKAHQTHGEWFDFGDQDPVTVVSAAVARLNPTLAEVRQRRAEAGQDRRAQRLDLLTEQLTPPSIRT